MCDRSSYIARRRSGERAPGRTPERGKASPGRARIVEQDCKLLLAVLNWAERARDDRDALLLDKNPLKGLAIPKEEAPRRPCHTHRQDSENSRARPRARAHDRVWLEAPDAKLCSAH